MEKHHDWSAMVGVETKINEVEEHEQIHRIRDKIEAAKTVNMKHMDVSKTRGAQKWMVKIMVPTP